ncbi:MAG: hypothetical protein ACTSX6_09170 [Candidatus Heimdallarchaeaceae archaeon]
MSWEKMADECIKLLREMNSEAKKLLELVKTVKEELECEGKTK